jgi:hypothetical protein
MSRSGAHRIGLALELCHSVGLDGRDRFAAIDDEYSDVVFERVVAAACTATPRTAISLERRGSNIAS